jgi:hypothetical protein
MATGPHHPLVVGSGDVPTRSQVPDRQRRAFEYLEAAALAAYRQWDPQAGRTYFGTAS